MRAFDRYQVDRRWLEQYSPDKDCELTEDVIRQLANWMARRYSRPALPNSFDARVKSAARWTTNALKNCPKEVVGLFLELVPWDEIADAEVYGVSVLLVVDPIVYESPSVRIKLEGLARKIGEHLGSCDGITVLESDILSTKDIPLYDVLTHKIRPWDYDHLSFQDGQSDQPLHSPLEI